MDPDAVYGKGIDPQSLLAACCCECGEVQCYAMGTPSSGLFVVECEVKEGGTVYFCLDCEQTSSRVARRVRP